MIYNHKYFLRTNIIQTLLGTQVSKTGSVLVLMALDRMAVELESNLIYKSMLWIAINTARKNSRILRKLLRESLTQGKINSVGKFSKTLEPKCLDWNPSSALWSWAHCFSFVLPQFLHLENGDNDDIYFLELLWGLSKLIYVRYLEQRPAQSKPLAHYYYGGSGREPHRGNPTWRWLERSSMKEIRKWAPGRGKSFCDKKELSTFEKQKEERARLEDAKWPEALRWGSRGGQTSYYIEMWRARLGFWILFYVQ